MDFLGEYSKASRQCNFECPLINLQINGGISYWAFSQEYFLKGHFIRSLIASYRVNFSFSQTSKVFPTYLDQPTFLHTKVTTTAMMKKYLMGRWFFSYYSIILWDKSIIYHTGWFILFLYIYI